MNSSGGPVERTVYVEGDGVQGDEPGLLDSRAYGPVALGSVVAIPLLRIWPFRRVGPIPGWRSTGG